MKSLKTTKALIGIVAFSFLISGFLTEVIAAGKGMPQLLREARAKIKEVNVNQAKSQLKGTLLIDVRTKDEYEAGHLPGAISVPRGLLELMIVSIVKNKAAKIIVYCRTGIRSAFAAAKLGEMGYTNIKSLSGGIKAWGESGGAIFNIHGQFKMMAFEKKG